MCTIMLCTATHRRAPLRLWLLLNPFCTGFKCVTSRSVEKQARCCRHMILFPHVFAFCLALAHFERAAALF